MNEQNEYNEKNDQAELVPSDDAVAAAAAFSWKKEVIEWAQAIIWAVVIALVIRTFIFTVAQVKGSSMVPTLEDGQRLIVWRLGYTPKSGDIIIFHPVNDPKSCYVKRVIATEGQSVSIDYATSSVMVDGVALDEPYINEKTLIEHYGFTEGTVPEGCVFVMGDNRNNSRDSRDMTGVGYVTRKSILGKAVLRIWPFNKIGTVKTIEK